MSDSLPSREQALQLLRRAGCSVSVIEHCETVADVAGSLARRLLDRGFNLDLRLVEAGAYLHDIGRSETHGVPHAYRGGLLARGMGLPSSLVELIERHIGAGIPAEEASKLGLPSRDFLPQSLEEKVVSYADKLVAHNRRITFPEALREMSEKLGRDHPAVERFKKLHEELSQLLAAEGE